MTTERRPERGASQGTFLEALGAGKEAAPTFRDGLATDYVTDAVLKSAKTRQWESV